MNGLIDFLVSKDARAMILRKNFVFMLVPMLNPDGVYHGHYRMDIYNQNLNRFYLTPNSKIHPGPFGMKCLA
jgi:murein tripeptide amidase MpaA